MQLDELIQKVTLYTSSPETESVLTTAFQIASEAHSGFQRINGEAYLSHPLAVAGTLAAWHAPLPVVTASLLHDIQNPDYSHRYSLDIVQSRVSPGIFRLLEAVIDFNGFMRQIERNFDEEVNVIDVQQHITSVLQQERDAVVIKIADRLDNLKTISALTRYFQERSARIGFNLLAPLADRLGMGSVKRQLEDYCFEIINLTYHKILKQYCTDVSVQREANAVLEELRQVFREAMPGSEVHWQFASLYTLYRHQIEQNAKRGKLIHAELSPLQLVDAGAFIILSEEEIDCYRALGTLHKLYPPVERKFRDLIGQNKENGYRSLHTEVKHPSGKLLYMIIRTRTMDLVAEHGITARWWNVPEEFLPQLPKQVKPSEEQIQVFTPNGEIKYLPQGATVLDFAYAIHTDVGNHCVGALVNGGQADMHRVLRSGDRIEIIPGVADTGPTIEWLDHVRTQQAINQVRQWLTQHQRNAMLERGRTLLDMELQPMALNSKDMQVRQLLPELAAKENFERVEDLLVSIGVGRHQAPKLVERMKSMRSKSTRSPRPAEQPFNVKVFSPQEASLPVTFARCCRPIPPDDIVGYYQKDHTLAIHKRTCPQVKEPEKSIPVEWDTAPAELHYVVVVEALNRPGLASDLSTAMTLSGLDMASFSAYKRADGVMAEAHIYLGRTTSTQRNRIQKVLEDVPFVTKVEVIHSLFFSSSMQRPEPSTPSQRSNPYGPTVAAGSRFYGREVECQRITDLLRDKSQSTVVLLWGQRRIGKTSLVLRLQEQSRGGFVPVYIDVQGLKDGSTTQFLHQLMRHISLALQEKTHDPEKVTSPPALNRLRKDPLTYFDTFMALVQEPVRNYPLVVILDEFQCLCSLREEVISRSAIFSRLRSHAQHGRGVHFILSGGGLLSQLAGQCDIASLFSIAHDEKLGCLEVQAARQLIRDGLVKVGNITERASDLLLDLTAGHPYYLQLLCSMLYDHTQENKVALTSHDAALSIREWISKADSSRFQHLWEGHDILSAQRNKLLLSAIAQLAASNHEVTYDRLTAEICPVVPEQKLVQSLQDLADLGVLEQNHSNYSIKVELFARWLRQHWPLELTLKEARWI